MQQATAPLSVKRKLAAILSADVKGYSRLMAADEEGTLRTLNAYRQEIDALVAGRDGRIVGSAGDSVLAEFPSAVEAARCAVEIQKELAARNGELPKDRRLEFRIGINLGDVMVEGDDLFGDGVNVAARLQALAEPGGIYVSGGIYDQIKGKLPFGADFLGEQTVKNIAEPVRVYRLRSDRATLRRAVPRRWRTWSAIAAGSRPARHRGCRHCLVLRSAARFRTDRGTGFRAARRTSPRSPCCPSRMSATMPSKGISLTA